jgi:hypothetical protein
VLAGIGDQRMMYHAVGTFLAQNVQDCARKVTRPQCVEQSPFIDQLPAGGINELGAGIHPGKLFFAEKPLCRVRQAYVKTHDSGLSEKIFKIGR